MAQYEFQLSPNILKQIYFEYQFFFEIVQSFLNSHPAIDQKAAELSQKILKLIMKSIGRSEGRKVNVKYQVEESDVFSEEEVVRMNKSLRTLKLIHEYNF